MAEEIDALAAFVDAVLVHLRAGTYVPTVKRENIVDTPIDPTQDTSDQVKAQFPRIEVTPLAESEQFSGQAQPTSRRTEGQVLITIKVRGNDWRTNALSLRDGVRRRLLTQPDFVSEWGLPKAFATEFQFLDSGSRAYGIVMMAVTYEYETRYKPDVTAVLGEVRIQVDAIDPAADPNVAYPGPDGRIEVEARITLATGDRRVTEAGLPRVTEAGDQRIVEDE